MANTHVAVLLGTRTKYENRLKGNYARSETLSFLFDAIPGRIIASSSVIESGENINENITKSILDGPDLAGKQIHECIAKGFIQLLTALSQGATTGVILAHSRGAVFSIIIAHLLQAMQKECINPKQDSLLSIINSLELADEYSTSDKLELNKIKLELKKQPQLVKKIQPLSLSNIQANIKNFKLKINAVDPVPGGGNHKLNLHWNCGMMLRIPKIVESYQQIIYLHERTRGFKPILPVVDDASTQFSMQFLPGHHGTGSGNFGYQQPVDGFVRVYNEQSNSYTQYDTSTVQEVLLCRLISFIESTIPGFKFIPSNFEKILERAYQAVNNLILDWNTWLKRYQVKSLKSIALEFIGKNRADQKSFFIALYKKIYRNLAGYESMRSYSYAGTRKGFMSYLTPFAVEESVRKVFRLLEQPKRIVLSICLLGTTHFMNFGARNIDTLYHSDFIFSKEERDRIGDHEKEPLLLKVYTGINQEMRHKASHNIKELTLRQNSVRFYIATIAAVLAGISLFGYFVWPIIAPYVLAKLALIQAVIINFLIQYKIIKPIMYLLSTVGSLVGYLMTPLMQLLSFCAVILARFIEFITRGNEYLECIVGVAMPVVTYLTCGYAVKALGKELYHYTGLELAPVNEENNAEKLKDDPASPGRVIAV